MSKYIDADKLIKKLIAEKEHYMEQGHGDGGINMIIASIENAPPAEVAPVVHGRWIFDEEEVNFVCPICDAGVPSCWDYDDENMFRFCPVCGAKMDGDKNE